MHKIYLRPGAVVAGVALTIPADAPRISRVSSAEIWRMAAVLAPDDHNSALLSPGADFQDHTALGVVGAVAVHAAHPHNLTTVVAAGGGAAMTEPLVAGPLESAGGGQVNPGAVDVLAAAQAHAAGAAPLVNAFGAGAPVAHTNVASQILQAVVPTLVAGSNSQFTLNVTTRVDDLLSLNYEPEGERTFPS